jgi:hypothetical protein
MAGMFLSLSRNHYMALWKAAKTGWQKRSSPQQILKGNRSERACCSMGHSAGAMGVKKKRVEQLERNVERKFFVFSALAVALVVMAVMLALLGNK